MSSRHFKPEIRVSSLRFSPTGRFFFLHLGVSVEDGVRPVMLSEMKMLRHSWAGTWKDRIRNKRIGY